MALSSVYCYGSFSVCARSHRRLAEALKPFDSWVQALGPTAGTTGQLPKPRGMQFYLCCRLAEWKPPVRWWGGPLVVSFTSICVREA